MGIEGGAVERFRLPWALFCFWVLMVGWVSPVFAHAQRQNAMWVLWENGGVRLGMQVSSGEIAAVSGLDPAQAGSEGFDAAAREHAVYVLEHVEVGGDGEALQGALVKVTPPVAVGDEEGTLYLFEFFHSWKRGVPERLGISHRMLKEYAYSPGQPWEVSYVVRFKREGSEEVESQLLTRTQPVEFGGRVEPGVAGAVGGGGVGRFFREGVHHILSGYDHLLFVSALVLVAGSFWGMVRVIGAFTLAHTVTLVLSVFGWVRLSSAVVEPAIAASIVCVAVENLLWPGRTGSWMRTVVAFAFGLVHGLGFAGGLLSAMEGLPGTEVLLALAGFSAGVEIGHQMVVLPLCGLVGWAGARWPAGPSRSGAETVLQRYGSAGIGLAGLYYLVLALGLL